MSFRFNTKEEALELEAARSILGAACAHIADWVYDPCRCNKHLADQPKCANCKRKVEILNREHIEKRADGLAAELRMYGYSVVKPT